MTYHHKRGSCLKETREILDDILHMKKSEYETIQPSSVSSTPKPKEEKQAETANILPGDNEAIMSEEEQAEMESYEPTQEMDFEVDEVKDCLEKKKKRRNYIEFRPDYEKD